MWSTWATHPVTMGRSFRRVPRPWFTGLVGITPRTLVPQFGMAGLTRTVWEPDSPTPPIPDGASGLAADILTILGITLGGDRWGITVMAGIPITAGEHGEAQPSPMYMESGATRLTLVPAQPGRIRIQ